MISEETLHELNLVEGSKVELRSAEDSPAERTASVLSTKKGMESYNRTKPAFESAYRDLAK